MAHSTDGAAFAALQRHIDDLEIELAITLGELRRLRAGAVPFEEFVLAELRDCNAAAARAALLARNAYLSDVDVLEADARVLRAILAECHDFLSHYTAAARERDIVS